MLANARRIARSGAADRSVLYDKNFFVIGITNRAAMGGKVAMRYAEKFFARNLGSLIRVQELSPNFGDGGAGQAAAVMG